MIQITDKVICTAVLCHKKMRLFKRKDAQYITVDHLVFSELMKNNDHIVLDVRWEGELSQGTIPGSKQINFFNSTFKEEIAKLDRAATYLVYCRSGARSSQTCEMMGEMGFDKVYNLKGGIQAWKKGLASKS